MATIRIPGSIKIPIGSTARLQPDGVWLLEPAAGEWIMLVSVKDDQCDPPGTSALSVWDIPTSPPPSSSIGSMNLGENLHDGEERVTRRIHGFSHLPKPE